VHQIKIFKGIESDTSELEKSVNRWLAESKARVIQIFGNMSPQSPTANKTASLTTGAFAPSDVMIVVLYEQP
jgi:hypothetical protein